MRGRRRCKDVQRKQKKDKRIRNWKKRELYGQFLNKRDEYASEEKCLWLTNDSMKIHSGSFIFAAQEQAFASNANRGQN